jgi:hypothetical protein
MSLWKLVLIGIAAAGSLSVLPQPSGAASLPGVARGDFGVTDPRLERVIFHGHASSATSFYCYPRNYWWFYRPYTTAQEGYARCMPYFHYPPQAARHGARGGLK